MNFESDVDSMEFTTTVTKYFEKNNKNTSFNPANDEYKHNNSNSLDNLSIIPPRSNCTMISQSSNDRDTYDSDDSVDCDNPDDYDNLNFMINSQKKSETSYLPSVNSFSNNFTTDKNLGSTSSPCNYLLEKNTNFNGDYLNSSNKIQYLLMAHTSPAVKVNEETLTYLNQGQSYELKFNKLNTNNGLIKKSDSDNEDLFKNQKDTHRLNDSKDENMYLSLIRLCFWERKLQEIEHEEIKEWEKEYNHVRMLEVDKNLSYGSYDVCVTYMSTNSIEVIWSGKIGSSIFIKCNCTSTAFAKNKHGGEKGVHLRLQIDTYEITNSSIISPINTKFEPRTNSKNMQVDSNSKNPTNWWKHFCSSYCRIQLFRLKGAQRKLKTDRLKIERLNPVDLKRRYQKSDSVTILYNTGFDNLYSLVPLDRNELGQLQIKNKQLLSKVQNDSIEFIQSKAIPSNEPLNGKTFYPNNSSSFCCENDINNNNTEKIDYYVENNSFNFNDAKYDVIKELMIDDLTSIIDDDTDNFINSLSIPARRSSLNKIIKTNDSTMFTPIANSSNINKPFLTQTSSLAHDLCLSENQQNLIAPKDIKTTTTLPTKQSSQMSVVSENRAIATAQQVAPLSNVYKILPNLPLKTDLTSSDLNQWLVANRFTHLIPIFQNYSTNDFLRLTKDDLIKLCGAPDAIRCYNLAHNIQICPRLSFLVKLVDQIFFSAIYLPECKVKHLNRRLIQFYNSQKVDIVYPTSQVINQPSVNSIHNVKKIDIDIDENLELYMKFKGVLIKISDEVLSNINNDTKFNVEFILNHQEATEANKSLVVYERDSDYKLKSTDKILSSSAIIMIPID